jgi:septal ring factor EnvC (AmiA/AmiB activator)
MNMLIVGAVVLMSALLIVGEVTWVMRGREFTVLSRQIDELNRKLADAELRSMAQQEKINDSETSLATAKARLEGLARLERELHDERKNASDLNSEMIRLRAQAKANEAQISSTLESTRRERQEKWAEITSIGKELHTQLRSVGDHVNGLSTQLDHLVREFNEMIGGLEGSLMPQAQRINELTMQGASEPLASLKPVDTVVRFPRPDRDLASPGDEQEIVAAD